MSRIFTIEGNFKQGGKWSQPDPSFKGEIAVEDDGVASVGAACETRYDVILWSEYINNLSFTFVAEDDAEEGVYFSLFHIGGFNELRLC